MKNNKGWKSKLARWYHDIDWHLAGGIKYTAEPTPCVKRNNN